MKPTGDLVGHISLAVSILPQKSFVLSDMNLSSSSKDEIIYAFFFFFLLKGGTFCMDNEPEFSIVWDSYSLKISSLTL